MTSDDNASVDINGDVDQPEDGCIAACLPDVKVWTLSGEPLQVSLARRLERVVRHLPQSPG